MYYIPVSGSESGSMQLMGSGRMVSLDSARVRRGISRQLPDYDFPGQDFGALKRCAESVVTDTFLCLRVPEAFRPS